MYATYEDLEKLLSKKFSETEITLCNALLEQCAVIIDTYNQYAEEKNKNIVSCNMVKRAMANSGIDIPIGSTQGSMSALGYSQSWTMSNGSTGELYLSKYDKKLLGVGNRIGSHSVLEDMV